LKSTSGQSEFGIQHWTQLVVEEISILPFSKEHLNFCWKTDRKERVNANIYVAPSVHSSVIQMAKESNVPNNQYQRNFHQMSIDHAVNKITREQKSFLESGSLLPKFDLAILSRLEEIDPVIRPVTNQHFSLVRPRGAILLSPNPNHSPSLPHSDSSNMKFNILWDAIVNRKIEIRTTRCGDARQSLKLLEEMPELASKLCEILFTHEFRLCEINKAFEIAKNGHRCVKVLIDTISPFQNF
jgi:threonine dehydrogenase-like Zn-dependent dehydrogenase